MKYVFLAAIAAIFARGILGLIDPSALNAPDRPKPVAPHVQVSAEGPPGTASGYVYDAKTGEPLIGAFVTVEQTELGTATDLSGMYTIDHIPLGKHQLSASYIGFYDPKVTVAIDSVHGVMVDFWLAPRVYHTGPVE